MSRSVTVSTDVYAAIWAARNEGENSENEVLARILKCKKADAGDKISSTDSRAAGFYDSRNDVTFDEGFQIFRIYKGMQYSAIAKSGSWLRVDNGKAYASLNQLNKSIAAGQENVWNGNWKYKTQNGKEASLDNLRIQK